MTNSSLSCARKTLKGSTTVLSSCPGEEGRYSWERTTVNHVPKASGGA